MSPRRPPRRAGPAGPAVSQLLFLLDTSYDHTSWHGPNLRGSIRGVTPAQAAWRPAPGRHNIWELIVHAAYWKYVAWRRLTAATRGSFPAGGSNWLSRPVGGGVRASVGALKADIELLDEMHTTLRASVEPLTDFDLQRRIGRSAVTVRALVTGVAAHDLYHAGQIQLVKRLL